MLIPILVFIGDKMSKFCPEWIYSTFAAQTSKEFLSSNNSIAAISRKYSTAILNDLMKLSLKK